jgi:hypothetical protein
MMRSLGSLAVVAVMLGIAGCSRESPRVPTYPVEGQVLLNGKPPVGAQVVLHARNNPGGAVLRPTGQVDTTGKFTLTTYTANDGAPVGDYDVTVEWWVAQKDRPAANQLPPRYRQPQRSGLQAKISADGPNSLPTFKLAR